MNSLGYLLVYLIPLWAVAGAQLGGAWTFSALGIAFVLTPLFDAVVSPDERNADEAEENRRANNPVYDMILLAWVPLQLFVIGWGVYQVSFVEHSWVEILGITLSVGITTGGGGINIAHELMHRRERRHRAAAELLMGSVTYTHFCVEHVLGHHKRVATPEDPASARLGESLYSFYPRCVWGSLRSAWSLEAARCQRRGIRGGSLRDRRTRYLLTLATVYAAVGFFGGWVGLLYFVGQSFVAFTLLEVINYVEHYGLSRRKLDTGRYEKVTPRHSWNSAHRVTGFYLFNLPRHADHHHIASRPYWKLRHVPDSPQLPAGYATMLLCALVPPLWRRIMDPRVAAWQARHEVENAPATAQPVVAGAA